MKTSGTVARGELGHDAKVTAVDLDATTPTATLSDCLDLSRWQAVRTQTGEPVPLPTNQPRRYVATVTAERRDGRWMVTVFKPHGEQAC
ncbi:hypothetical protein [Streptomyces xanthophaeus]